MKPDKNPTNQTSNSRRLETAHKWLKWATRFKRKGDTNGQNGPMESPKLVEVQNSAAGLDQEKREIVAARFFEVSVEAILQAAVSMEGS